MDCSEISANIIMWHQFIKNQLFSDLLLFKQEVKKELVQYFKNKQRVLPAESKNLLIYNGDVETAYLEIVNLYNIHGNFSFYFVSLYL